jgi:hypothetical protein
MTKWRLSRKRKKQFKKDVGVYHRIFTRQPHFFNHWENYYHKNRVWMRNMKVIITYPYISSDEETTLWFINTYKNQSNQYYFQNLQPFKV